MIAKGLMGIQGGNEALRYHGVYGFYEMGARTRIGGHGGRIGIIRGIRRRSVSPHLILSTSTILFFLTFNLIGL